MEVIVTETSGYFRRWANQWRDADRDNRSIVEFSARGRLPRLRQRATELYEQAADDAGRRGKVIISVGHGGDSTREGVVGDATIGMVDLAPRRALRLQRANVFYNDREHDERTLREVARIGAARCRRLGRRRQQSLQGDDAWDAVYCRGAPAAREDLAIRRAYEAIGASFQQHGVSEVVLLTCRVGNSTAFVDQIAGDWGVTVTAYQRRVAANQDADGQYRVYLFGDAEGRGTNRERARTQLPNRERYTTTGPSGDDED